MNVQVPDGYTFYSYGMIDGINLYHGDTAFYVMTCRFDCTQVRFWACPDEAYNGHWEPHPELDGKPLQEIVDAAIEAWENRNIAGFEQPRKNENRV